MRKKWLILLVSLALNLNCKHVGFDYQIIPPSCEEGEIRKVCEAPIYYNSPSVYALPAEECPPNYVATSVDIQMNCFRAIDHYISELEIRNEVCSTGSSGKLDKSLEDNQR
jgi:hypothetical protein